MAFIRPSFIDNMGYHMGEVYGAVTDQILINLARYFPYWTESTVPKSAFEYQATMLAQMGQVNAETVQILRNGLKGGNAALKDILEQAIMESVKKSFPELLKGVQNGIFNPETIPVLAPNQMQAFQFYYQQAAQKLNLVNTVMLESTRQAYQNTVADIVTRVQATQVALDVGAAEVVTGVSAWNQAAVHAINRMKDNGITGFIDHAGRHWSAEAYTSMDIRTTVANTARAAIWETNQNFGNDLYLVSFHNGARPLCYPWQNKVISANDNAGVTYDLDGNEIQVIRQSDTSYGEPAGLFGINCKHYPTPFIPGVSVIYGQPQDKAENDRVYAESQQQRALERKIREEKRDLLMMKARGEPDEYIKAQREKIRQTDDDIDAFCEKTGRARRQNREGVYTKREFPDPHTYDVTTFERTQKELIDKYFENGGAQQGYTFGQMTPNEQITPQTPPVVPNYNFGGNNATITKEGQTTIKDTIQMLQEQFPIPEGYTLDVSDFRINRGIGFEEDLFDVLDRLENESKINEPFFGVKAEFHPSGSDGKALKIQYIDTTMPNYDAKETVFKTIHEAQERSPGNVFNAGWGYECDTIHEYGHLLSHVYGFYGSEDPEFVEWFNTLDKELIKQELSIYAATNWNEFFAESFLQSFSPYQSDLSKKAMDYLRRKMGR